MNQLINLSPIVNEIRLEIEQRLEKLGLFCRIFARGKSLSSIDHKLKLKSDVYKDGKKMQDIVGVRIVLYFADDVDVVYEYMKNLPNYVDESNSEKEILQLDKDIPLKKIGKLYDKLFMPERLNLIFRMSPELTDRLCMALYSCEFSNLIDNTYEVQIRTIFSEGWHEVEHDLRYKCKGDPMWDYCREESRMLNGIYASLETTEASMRSLFDSIAYKNLKRRDWVAMLRNKFCIRFEDGSLSGDVCDLLTADNAFLGKELYKFRRGNLFLLLRSLPTRIPRKMDNIVFLINRARMRDERLISLEPLPISNLLDDLDDSAGD